MVQRYSIVEARAHLARIIDEAQSGQQQHQGPDHGIVHNELTSYNGEIKRITHTLHWYDIRWLFYYYCAVPTKYTQDVVNSSIL